MIISLYLTVCVISSYHCSPEVIIPGKFENFKQCDAMVQSIVLPEHSPLHLVFRCAGET